MPLVMRRNKDEGKNLMALYALRNILSNPFRHIARCPIDPDKVEALRKSIRSTKAGFWDNLLAREAPGGKAEIAYGHHRLEALKAEYPLAHQVDLIIKPLDDANMLKTSCAGCETSRPETPESIWRSRAVECAAGVAPR